MVYNVTMNKFKEELKKVKSWLIIISYAGLMGLLVLNFGVVVDFLHLVIVNLNALFYGLIFAFVLNIPMGFIEKLIHKYLDKNNFIYRHSRGISITLAVIFLFAVISLVLMVLIPELVTSFARLISNANSYFNDFMKGIINIMNNLHVDPNLINDVKAFDFNSLMDLLGLDYSNILSEISDILLHTGLETITQIANFGSYLFYICMGFMIAMYMLGSKEKLITQMKKTTKALFSKDISDEILRIADISNEIFRDFVGGKFVEVCVVGVMVYLLMIVFRMPYAILIAVMCGVSAVIPVVGSMVAMVIACFILLTINPLQSLLFIVIFQLVLNIDGNIIYPKFIGKGLGLPAIWIVVSVLFFSGFFSAYGMGVVGMLIAVPFTACVYTFFSEYIHHRLKRKGIE